MGFFNRERQQAQRRELVEMRHYGIQKGLKGGNRIPSRNEVGSEYVYTLTTEREFLEAAAVDGRKELESMAKDKKGRRRGISILLPGISQSPNIA